MRLIGGWSATIISALSISCGGGDGITGAAPVSSVSVVISTANLIVGTTTQASATIKDSGGNVLSGRALTWTSDNSDVANVDSQGLVTAVGPGTATITATTEGKRGSAGVTVATNVSQIVVDLPQPGLAVGYTIQASSTVKDAAGNALTGKKISWSSSNSAVAAVNESGIVTGVSPGAADIIAASEGKTGATTIGIVVISPQSLSAGSRHTCAISIEGDAYCWGYNSSGALGDGTTTDRLSPVRVAGTLKFSAIAAKAGYTYALTSDGRLFCWGAFCQPSILTLSPRQVETSRAIYFLGDGMVGNCAIGLGNVAYCWGNNDFGQSGTGKRGGTSVAPEEPVAGNHRFVDTGSSENAACAITANGAAYCWGSGPAGITLQPEPMSGGYSFKDLAAGGYSFCGLDYAGATYCWSGSAAVPVQGGYGFESINSGWNLTCGLTAAGDPYCWGYHPYGQPGGLTPVSFRHWSGPSAADPYASVKYGLVSPGGFHVCATSTEGDIYCMNHWHEDATFNRSSVGFLGDGTTDISRAVRKVIGGIKFRVQ